MSLYDAASLSKTPSLSTAVLSAVISLSNLSGLIAILPPSRFNYFAVTKHSFVLFMKLTGTTFMSLLQLS